ncbi:glycerophosphodiester phosphodiesterase [Paenibacillus konkukensis]|nr:glycerophosphodiester phosphodiesterase family protein [Paenibacillus konkukensis]
MFMNLAHRGASHYAPENTFAAFYKGLEMGANGLETDLRRTNDGVIILQHDEQLDRNTNGNGKLSDYTWREVAQLDAGSWFSDFYQGEPLVTLTSFFRHFARRPVLLALELKEPGMEKEVSEMIAVWKLYERVTITAFDFEVLQELRRRDDRVRLGYLTYGWDSKVRDQLAGIRAVQFCPKADLVTVGLVNEVKQAGYEIRAWGIRKEEQMMSCLQASIDGMTINYPDRLTEALKASGGSVN